MTSPPPPHPSLPGLSLHLSDSTLAPLVSTAAPSAVEAPPLKLLATAALSAHTAAARLGLGYPVRILVETRARGPIVLHSFLDPQAQRMAELQRKRLHDVLGDVGVDGGAGDDGTAEEGTKDDDKLGHDEAAHDEVVDEAVDEETANEETHKHDEARDEPPEAEETTDKQPIEAASPLPNAPTSTETAETDETQPSTTTSTATTTTDTHPQSTEESSPAESDLTPGLSKLQLEPPALPLPPPPPPAPPVLEEEEEDTTPMAPMLVTTVVAESYSRLSDARRAAQRLESMGRGFQEQWVREQEEGEGEDGEESESGEERGEGEAEGAPEDG